MNHKLITSGIALAALVGVGPVWAHHSISMFDISAPIWVKGTVVSYEPINPHTMIALDEKREDGRVQRWIVEGPILARLTRMRLGADFLHAGDVIEVCGFALKDAVSAQRPSAEPARASRPPFVHGHLLALPDGRLQPWGPYGKFDNCVRPDDRSESWLVLLNRDPIARDLWCAPHRRSVPTRADSKALIDEIDRSMTDPCD